MSLLQYPCRVQKQKPFILRLTAELNCIQQDYLYHLPPCSLSSNCFLLPPVTLACLTTCSAIKQNMFLEHLYVNNMKLVQTFWGASNGKKVKGAFSSLESHFVLQFNKTLRFELHLQPAVGNSVPLLPWIECIHLLLCNLQDENFNNRPF